MVPSRPSASSLRVADLDARAPTSFEVRPDKAECAALAKSLGVDALRKVAFSGTVAPLGDADWQLDAKLGATVVQPCVVTLEPVTTRIDIPVRRSYLRGYEHPDEPEMEMPEDDSTEPLGLWIDPAAVMEEELALAVPAFPRKANASLDPVRVTEPGKQPMRDEDARPFAGLADLKAQLNGSDTTDD